MRVHAALVTLAASVALAAVRAQPPADQAPQTFRTGTELVFVDVSVRSGGRPVSGLRAGDFVVTDNGVRQRVESVETTAVPIDLTVIADVTGNVANAWSDPVPMSRTVNGLQREMQAITATLRPDDRVRLFAIDRHVQLVVPLSPAKSPAPMARVEIDGLSSLYDTLAAALVLPTEPARRHVIVARTKGVDSISAVDAAAVRALAAQSDARLHLAMMETAADNDDALKGFQCEFLGWCWSSRRFWMPYQQRLLTSRGSPAVRVLTPAGTVVAEAAEATGGGLHRTELLNEATLLGTFRRAFEDFRSSYVLRYSPSGVPPGGWHAIDVKVPKGRDFTVRARRGYGIDTEVTAPAPAAPTTLTTLADLTRAYDARAYPQVSAAIEASRDYERLLKGFEEGGNPWPAQPRREAAFALELAAPGLVSTDRELRERGLAVLQRFTGLVRDPLEAGQFERYWYFGLVTLLESLIRPGISQPFVDRAVARFPDEPRFLLSRAIVRDQQWPVDAVTPVTDAAGTPTSSHIDSVVAGYAAAAASPATAGEARTRLAWFLHRLRRHDEALAEIDKAGELVADDPPVRYLRLLILGHVLNARQKQQEAEQAYRGALEIFPTAQSARVALMNMLVLKGDRATARQLAEDVQSGKSAVFDPWWAYWQGQGRLHEPAMTRLREMAR